MPDQPHNHPWIVQSNLSNVAVLDKMGNNVSPPWPMVSSKNVVSKAIPLVGLVVLVGGVVVPVVVSMVTSDKMQQCHGNNVVGVEEMGVVVPPVFVAILAKETPSRMRCGWLCGHG